MTDKTKIKYFLYARKSSEAEDKQVASIDAQIDVLKKFAQDQKLELVEILSEAKSAKAPGRPVFNNMVGRIEKGEADGILCWKLDRLARNPVDGGLISWRLQTGIIKHIQTPGRGYLPTDNVLMMSVEFGMANQFIRDLSDNAKRGMLKKAKDGWLPTNAPVGYLNTPDRQKGTKIIIRDPDRFPLIKKMWDMMVSWQYTVPEILKIVNSEWGFRHRETRSRKTRPMSRTGLYKIFSNPFYTGRYEFPLGSGDWHEGKHEKMISWEDFQRVQIRLGRKGNRSPHTRTFAFTGLIRCGECSGAITAEEKHQLICPSCKLKFAYQHKDACPGCNIAIEEMKKPTVLKYTYYHCTKRKLPKCSQGWLKVEELEKQIDSYLGTIQINQKYLDWALKHLRKSHEEEMGTRVVTLKSQQQAYSETSKKLDRLLELRLNGEIDEREYLAKKEALTREKSRYNELLRDSDANQDSWLTLAEKAFNFAHRARSWFEEARQSNDLVKQREVLGTLGLNLSLKGGILAIQPPEPFVILQNGIKQVPEAAYAFEPKKRAINKRENLALGEVSPIWGASPVSNQSDETFQRDFEGRNRHLIHPSQ